MSTRTYIGASIDNATMRDARETLDSMGLTASDAISMLMECIAAEKRLPFGIKIPSASTLAAFDELERGEFESFDSVEELMDDLDADD